MRPWRFTLRTIEPRHFGTGWISGVLAAALGAIGFGAVVCFHYPSIFTVPELRALYPLAYMRALLHLVLVGAFVLGAISVTLRQNKALGVSGIGFALAAALLGGSQVPVDGELTQGPFLGLDWFLLSLMLYSATFVPLERLFALRPEQDVFRPAWRTDLIYFGMSALLLQLTTLLTMGPAMVFFDWAASAPVQAWVSSQPGVVQFLEILVLTDLCQYLDPSRLPPRAAAVALPRDPPLGRDDGLDRRRAPAPRRRGGDARPDLRADLRARLRSGRARRLRRCSSACRPRSSTPTCASSSGRWRGWWRRRGSTTGTTASSPRRSTRTSPIHLPVLDWLFGTFHLPKGRWPSGYGVHTDRPVPDGFLRQLAHPFRRRP